MSGKQSQLKPQFEVNDRFILFYTISLAINGICVANTTGGNNQTAGIFAAKLGWDEEQTRKNNTLIAASSQFGKFIGAYLGGRIIFNGRKSVYLYGNLVSMLSCLIMQYLSIETLIIGKFINGISVSVVHVALIKMINETVPSHLQAKYGPLTNILLQLGYLTIFGLGLGLP